MKKYRNRVRAALYGAFRRGSGGKKFLKYYKRRKLRR